MLLSFFLLQLIVSYISNRIEKKRIYGRSVRIFYGINITPFYTFIYNYMYSLTVLCDLPKEH